MNNIFYLDVLDNNIPLRDIDLYYVDLIRIQQTNPNIPFEHTLSGKDKDQFKMMLAVNGTYYSRFDLTNNLFNLHDNLAFNSSFDILNKDHRLDFNDITDSLAVELLEYSIQFNNVYLFWSGGIDSTLILIAILKNWPKESLDRLTVVLNQYCIDEHPVLYNSYIKDKLKTTSVNLFFLGITKFNNNDLYVTGNHGDCICTPGVHSDLLCQKYPESLNKPWTKNKDIILDYLSANANIDSADIAYQYTVDSLTKYDIQAETVYDFLSWIEFDKGWCGDSVYMGWVYSTLDNTVNAQEFFNKNVFRWFSDVRYQQWSVSKHTDPNLKFRNTSESVKWVYKKYIFDFDKDRDYFLYKKKEQSIPKNKKFEANPRLVAVDTSYNLYYCKPVGL